MKRETSVEQERFRLLGTDVEERRDDFAEAVRAGLDAEERTLPCRFLYDAEGSRIFEEICALPEYYLTRAEDEILRQRAGEILALAPAGAALVELGSGSSEKTRNLIAAGIAREGRLVYVPIDISGAALREAGRALVAEFPALEIVAFAAEYQDGLHLAREELEGPKLVAWLGSNVGNFDRAEAAAFLRRVRDELSTPDRLLVGVDLRKDRATLEAAYDDPSGTTARFNLNLLARINRDLGGDFDLERFAHRATWNPKAGRVEIRIESLADQEVRVAELGRTFRFREGETIYTESSHKYSLEELASLAADAGFEPVRRWTDARERFSLSLWKPV